MTKSTRFLFLILLLSVVFAFLVIYLAQPSPIGVIWINSNHLYAPSLAYELVSGASRLNDWYLSPAPEFFPVILWFLIAAFFVKSAYYQILIFLALQILSLFFSVFLIAKATGRNRAFVISVAIVSYILYLAYDTAVWMDKGYFLLIGNELFGAIRHGGSFICSLFSVSLYLLWERLKKSHVLLVLMCVFSFVASLSDTLYIVQFIFPLWFFIALQRCFIKNKKMLVGALLLTLSSVLGACSYNILVAKPMRPSLGFSLGGVFSRLQSEWDTFYSLFLCERHLFFFYVVYFLCVILCIAAILFYLFGNIQKKLSAPRILMYLKRFMRKERGFLSFFILTFFSLLFTFFVPLFFSNRNDVPQGYLLPVLYFPVITTFLLLDTICSNVPLLNLLRGEKILIRCQVITLFFCMAASIFLAIQMIAAAYNFVKINGLPGNFRHPLRESCFRKFDNALEKYGISEVASPYWYARLYHIMSSRNIKVAQFTGNLIPFRWMTSEKYFSQEYRAFITSFEKTEEASMSLSLDDVERVNGRPIEAVVCHDYNYRVLSSTPHAVFPIVLYIYKEKD